MVTLTTSDGISLSADHYPSDGITITLFHMMPSTKESYKAFAEKLVAAGIAILAIDLRGHGASEGGPNGYKEYTDEQHRESSKDVDAAIALVHPQFIGGASIGANLSLQHIAKSDSVKKAILLSPGLNYKGIESLSLAKQVSPDKSIYIVAAKDDVRRLGSADRQGRQIFEVLNCQKKIKIFDTGGHGTDILDTHPEFMDELIAWLKED